MTVMFDHEKLRVYQNAVAFVGWCEELVNSCSVRGTIREQLDRAATSVVLNMAEGNGKWPGKDRYRFLLIARGSALECAACLDVLVAKKQPDIRKAEEGNEYLKGIVAMIGGLIAATTEQVAEEAAEYGSGHE